MSSDRIISRSDARQWCDAQRHAGTRVVLANGAFDLIHVGHVRYLEGARQAGDALLVAINSDDSVRLAKGPDRPIVPQAERSELVAALRVVDRVLLFDEATVRELLEELRPAVHAKGTDYTVENVPERQHARALGIDTVIVGDPKDHATTDVIGTIRDRFGGSPDDAS